MNLKVGQTMNMNNLNIQQVTCVNMEEFVLEMIDDYDFVLIERMKKKSPFHIEHRWKFELVKISI